MFKTHATLLGAVGLMVGPMAERAAAAPPAPCPGEVTLVSQSNVEVSVYGSRIVTEFDFTAVHTLCLRDGTVIDDAGQVGHLWMTQQEDGSGIVKFSSTVSHDGGQLSGNGAGQMDANGVISGRVWVNGGTGPLAGTTGHGWFRSTSPVTFEDVVWYSFH